MVVFERINRQGKKLLCVTNFSPEELSGYRVYVDKGTYNEVFNSDRVEYGGTGIQNGKIKTKQDENNKNAHYITLKLPRNSTMYFEMIEPKKI